MIRSGLLGVLSGAVIAFGANAAEPINMTLSGASPGGLWSVVAAGLDAALDAGIPGSSITYQTSSGGLANAALVSQGRVPLGMVGDMELNAAVKGRGPFAGKPLENLTVLFRAYDGATTRYQMFQPIINAEYAQNNGVKTFQDIIDKQLPIRVGVNRVGNMDSDIALELMEGVGLGRDKVKDFGGTVIQASSTELGGLMQDRRIDLVFTGYSFNHSTVREMANAIPLQMLPLPEEVVRKVAADNAGDLCTTKAGEYSWNKDVDLTTVCVGALIVAQQDFPVERAYDMTKAIVENIDKLQATHRALKQVTPAMMATPSAAPMHPGSEKFFKEEGLAH